MSERWHIRYYCRAGEAKLGQKLIIWGLIWTVVAAPANPFSNHRVQLRLSNALGDDLTIICTDSLIVDIAEEQEET